MAIKLKVLIVEDWWADRLRFELLLPETLCEVTFAWQAGRPGRVWDVPAIVDAASWADRLLIDLAWTKPEEDVARKIREKYTVDQLWEQQEELLQVNGYALLQAFEELGEQGLTILKERCIITSAYVSDALQDFIRKRWGVRGAFHKWEDERNIFNALF